MNRTNQVALAELLQADPLSPFLATKVVATKVVVAKAVVVKAVPKAVPKAVVALRHPSLAAVV